MPSAILRVTLLAAAGALFPAFLSAAPAEKDEPEKAGPMTAAEVLALKPEELTEALGDPSEAGQDRAAVLWAAAKRLETENKLARKDMKMVLVLNGWRHVLDRWQDTLLEVGYFQAGGGSMWGHDSARNDATLEEFLAAHAEALGKTTEEPGQPKALEISGPVMEAITKGIKVSQEELQNANAGKDGAELKKKVKDAESALALQLASLPDAKTREAVIAWAKEAVKMISEP